MDGNDLSLTLEQVNEILERFFGITLTEAQALDDIYYYYVRQCYSKAA